MNILSDEPSTIIDLPDITSKLSFAGLFEHEQPLEIDIGCGKGRFLLSRAASYPETNFIGIDRMNGRLGKLDRKIMRADLRNVRLIEMEAAYTVNELLPSEIVSVYYIFFPDPWPKRKHHRRRLMNKDFLNALYRTLIPDGQVNFSTDHLDYFEAGKKLLLADKRFKEIKTFQRSENEKTDFELIFTNQGLPIGNCSFKKINN
jgi:tRNA (guanine-N7-)-methyltransferase